MTLLRTSFWTSCALSLAAGTAAAQAYDPNPPVVVEPTPVYTSTDYDEEGEWMTGRAGVALSAGGGVTGFADDSLRDSFDPGGSWNVRLLLGTRSPVAFEASYIGSAQGVDAPGFDDDALLVSNGAQGALRLNLTTHLAAQPFVFGGVAWRRYEFVNTDRMAAGIQEDDDVVEIPLGGGIAGRSNGFILELRGEYRLSMNEDLMPDAIEDFNDDDGEDMHRWDVTASVGVEF